MKTPDEIKKGLEKEIPVHYHLPNPEPRLRPTELMELQSLHASAFAYITQLEHRLAQAEHERDAAIRDMHGKCSACKHMDEAVCFKCVYANWEEEEAGDLWEWRGVCPENSSDDEHQQA